MVSASLLVSGIALLTACGMFIVMVFSTQEQKDQVVAKHEGHHSYGMSYTEEYVDYHDADVTDENLRMQGVDHTWLVGTSTDNFSGDSHGYVSVCKNLSNRQTCKATLTETKTTDEKGRRRTTENEVHFSGYGTSFEFEKHYSALQAEIQKAKFKAEYDSMPESLKADISTDSEGFANFVDEMNAEGNKNYRPECTVTNTRRTLGEVEECQGDDVNLLFAESNGEMNSCVDNKHRCDEEYFSIICCNTCHKINSNFF